MSELEKTIEELEAEILAELEEAHAANAPQKSAAPAEVKKKIDAVTPGGKVVELGGAVPAAKVEKGADEDRAEKAIGKKAAAAVKPATLPLKKEELEPDLNEAKMSKMAQLFQYIRDGKTPEEIVKRMKDQWPRINIDVNTVKSLIKSIPANVYYVDGHPYLRHPMLGAYAYNEEKEKEGDKEKYVKFFDTAMKKFGINSPADLKSDEQKKEFYDYVDKNYKGDHEESLEKEEFIKKESYEIGTNEYRDHTLSVTPGQEDPDWVKLQRFKVSSMKEALAKIWGLKEKKLDKASKRAYEEEDENLRPVKGSKTMTGGKIAKVDITPKID